MRDAIAAERRGLPTVLVLNGALENIVEETARVVCMRDVPVVAVEEPLFGRNRDEIAEIVAGLYQRLILNLMGRMVVSVA